MPWREISEFCSAYCLCAKASSPSFSSPSLEYRENSVSSLFRNSTLETVFRPFPISKLVSLSADCKRGRRKGATSKNVKNRQKVSKIFSTLFDIFRAGQKTSKIVEKCQKVFRHFSTIFARHLFSGPFCNLLTLALFHTFPWLKNEKSAQRGSFWDGHPADIRGSFARISRPKTSVRAVKILEKQAFGRGYP